MYRQSLKSFKNLGLFRFSEVKLKYGQGGQLNLNLTKRNYHLQFETIWEDYCLIDFQGPSQLMKIQEQQQTGKAKISDEHQQQNNQQSIKVNIKIPEDFTFYGTVNGSIHHTKSQVSNKLRAYETKLQLLGKKRVFQWGTVQTPSLEIQNLQGAVDINNATFQTGLFNCHSLYAQKLLLSSKVTINAEHCLNCRSIVTYGNAEAHLKTCYLELQSISGKSEIEAEKVKIDRIWGSPNGINIRAKQLQKVGIQTGSGIIFSEEKLDMNKIILGRLHKGKILKVDDHTVKII